MSQTESWNILTKLEEVAKALQDLQNTVSALETVAKDVQDLKTVCKDILNFHQNNSVITSPTQPVTDSPVMYNYGKCAVHEDNDSLCSYFCEGRKILYPQKKST